MDDQKSPWWYKPVFWIVIVPVLLICRLFPHYEEPDEDW